MKTILTTFLLAVFFSTSLVAQKDKTEKITITGMVMDMKGSPLKGAHIFVDSIKVNQKTNKKGMYKVKLDSTPKLLTVYSEDHGLLSMEYNGQKKVSFLYKEDSAPLQEQELDKLGFKMRPESNSDSKGYADFATILEILDKRFFYVRVTNGKVKIGKGTNQFSGNSDPLVLVDDQRMPISVLSTIATTDVKNIRVIRSGSEAAEYGGLQAANGVILITLKKI